jgi:hypothetical protein
VFDTARTIRVVGEDETTKVQRINDPANPDSVDINQGKYDIVVETGPSYSTKRVEAADAMMQFAQAVPQAAALIPDLIARAQDFPMADEMAERFKRALPPQITESPDDEVTEEQMQAKQAAAQQAQMQQQMQMQAAQLDMAEREGKVVKLRADAEYTMAQARKLGMPEPGQPGKDPMELALLQEQVRKARAEADEAEAKAAIAMAGVPAQVARTNAEAERTVIGAESDRMDLERKPMEAMHSEADLNAKLNPPPENKSAA